MPQLDLGSPTPWRRSLRASQERRAVTARRRRRVLRSRGALAAMVLTTGVASGGAIAATTAGGARAQSKPARQSASSVTAVQRALGVPADGVVGPQTRKAIRRYERTHGLPVDGRIDPALLSSLGISPAPAAPSGDATSVLEQLAACESGGDPTAVSPDGKYRGKYQFTRGTWTSLGGTGDPAAAAEAEQDRLAGDLYAREGLAPWPACGAQISQG